MSSSWNVPLFSGVFLNRCGCFKFELQVKLECKKIKSISRAKTAYMFPNAILVCTEKKKVRCIGENIVTCLPNNHLYT